MSRLSDRCWTMREQNGQKPFTWRQLLRVHGPAFLTWLQQSEWERNALKRLATQLADFLIDSINRMQSEVSDAPIDFWSRIPEHQKRVLRCRDIRETFRSRGICLRAFARAVPTYILSPQVPD